VAFGLGGLVGTGASDLARWLIASPGSAYAMVFALEGLLFLLSAMLAWRISAPVPRTQVRTSPFPNAGDAFAAGPNPRQLS
jgi:BCD family chlorophyll transporter-like MFS transporter